LSNFFFPLLALVVILSLSSSAPTVAFNLSYDPTGSLASGSSKFNFFILSSYDMIISP
jgi:hypothetical protein